MLADAAGLGFLILALDFSPIKGPEGNIEYLGYLRVGAGMCFGGDLKELVRLSHETLKGEGQ